MTHRTKDDYERVFDGARPEGPLDDWLSKLEGAPIGSDQIRCDTCSNPIPPHEDSLHFFTDKITRADGPADHPTADQDYYWVRIACQRCRHGLEFPCRGYTEIVLAGAFDDQNALYDLRLAESSSSDEGIPWDPAEVFTAIATPPGSNGKAEWDRFARGKNFEITPVDFVDILNNAGIDLAALIDTHSGDLVADRDRLRRYGKHAKTRAEEELSGTPDENDVKSWPSDE
jgi:hypothetical protein